MERQRSGSRGARLLNRREFNGLCGALGSFVASPRALALDAAASVTSDAGRTVKFHDGTGVPALGQGSWHLGQGRHPAAQEEEALRAGLSLGMTLIDTAEGYSNGRSEELIGRAIAGQRDHVFLVSKVDHMATGDVIARACEASLTRLRTEQLDLYLAHWRDRGSDLSVIVTAFENLRTAGRFARGACPTSVSVTWKSSSVFHTAIAARPIRSLTTSATAILNAICCHGVSSMVCR